MAYVHEHARPALTLAEQALDLDQNKGNPVEGIRKEQLSQWCREPLTHE